MPRRLRISFVPSQNVTMPAVRATFGVTGQAATLTYTPNTVGDKGTWTQLTGGQTVNNTSWYWHAVDTARDRIYWATWGGYLYSMDRGTGLATQQARPWPTESGFHNRSWCFDPFNDRIWVGGGTTGGSVSNDRQFWVHPTTFVATLANDVNEPSTEAAFFYDPIGTGTVSSPTPQMVNWGGWNNKSLSVKVANPLASSWTATVIAGTYPPTSSEEQKMSQWRSVFDSRRRQYVTVDPSGALYILPATPGGSSSFYGGWVGKETSGGPPPANTSYVYDVSRDMIVGWCGREATAAGESGPTMRETWTMDMGTLVWTRRANAADGDTVPPESAYVMRAASYDESRKRTLLTCTPGSAETSVQAWVYTAPTRPAVGSLTTMALQPSTGSTYGTNNYGNPFARGQRQKHVMMAYCPLNNRLYALGGDWLTSATDGMWSMDCSSGLWRMESSRPNDTGLASPSAYQDTFGFWWDGVRSRFVVVPRGQPGYAYNVLQYGRGYWTFDPVNAGGGHPFGAWTQDLRLWGTATYNSGTSGSFTGDGTGVHFGGIFDSLNNYALVVYDAASSAGTVIKRWNLSAGTQLSSVSWSPASMNLTQGSRSPGTVYSRWVTVGRNAYGLCTSGGASTELVFLKLNMDTYTVSRLSAPVVNPMQTYIPTGDATWALAAAGTNHIVWPANSGPEGAIMGVHVYNITTDRWVMDDVTIPLPPDRFTPYESGGIRYMGGGSICEISNGSVAICASEFNTNNVGVTHMLFYTPTGVSP